MSDDLHTLFADALSAQARPAMGNLVETAITQGTRARRRRRAASAGGLVGTIGAVVAVVVGSGAVADHATAPRTVHAAADPTPRPTTTATLPATPQGMAQLLTDLLPAGSITYLAQAGDHIEAYLNEDGQTGMVRIMLGDASVAATAAAHAEGCVQSVATCAAPSSGTAKSSAEARALTAQQEALHGSDHVACTAANNCSELANGDEAFVTDNAGNCIQTQSVDVVHPDGTFVQFDLATCLEWNGTANPVSPQVMTADQAIALASDARWDLNMDASLVAAGAQNFPSMPYFS